jgi:hypothetical protein
MGFFSMTEQHWNESNDPQANSRAGMIWLACLLAFVLGCSSPTSRTLPLRDEWETVPSGDDVLESTWQRIPADRIFVVLSERKEEAESKLKEASIVSLNGEKLTYYLGKELEVPVGKKPFLVRGLGIEQHMRYGAWMVLEKGNKLWVRFGCLGNQLTSYIKSPVIVLLDSAPDTVYVDAHMAR